MKFLVEAIIPTETGNEKLRDGSMIKAAKAYFDQIKPEALYFGVAQGQRAVYFVVNMDSAEKMPEIAEPLWLDMDAELTFTPVMDGAEFEKAGAAIHKIVKVRAGSA